MRLLVALLCLLATPALAQDRGRPAPPADDAPSGDPVPAWYQLSGSGGEAEIVRATTIEAFFKGGLTEVMADGQPFSFEGDLKVDFMGIGPEPTSVFAGSTTTSRDVDVEALPGGGVSTTTTTTTTTVNPDGSSTVTVESDTSTVESDGTTTTSTTTTTRRTPAPRGLR